MQNDPQTKQKTRNFSISSSNTSIASTQVNTDLHEGPKMQRWTYWK